MLREESDSEECGRLGPAENWTLQEDLETLSLQ